jgi:hypothetical protein
MKITIIIGVLSLLISKVAMGHLGETLEQCGERYGEPTLAMKDSVIYKKNGFQIGTFFVNGKVEGVTYKKETKDGFFPEKISLEEIYQILKSNCPDAVFTPKETATKWAFLSNDGSTYADYDLIKHVLVLMTREGRQAMEQERLKKANSTTGGL